MFRFVDEGSSSGSSSMKMSNVTCGACQGKGHNRKSKFCPNYYTDEEMQRRDVSLLSKVLFGFSVPMVTWIMSMYSRCIKFYMSVSSVAASSRYCLVQLILRLVCL